MFRSFIETEESLQTLTTKFGVNLSASQWRAHTAPCVCGLCGADAGCRGWWSCSSNLLAARLRSDHRRLKARAPVAVRIDVNRPKTALKNTPAAVWSAIRTELIAGAESTRVDALFKRASCKYNVFASAVSDWTSIIEKDDAELAAAMDRSRKLSEPSAAETARKRAQNEQRGTAALNSLVDFARAIGEMGANEFRALMSSDPEAYRRLTSMGKHALWDLELLERHDADVARERQKGAPATNKHLHLAWSADGGEDDDDSDRDVNDHSGSLQ